MKKMYAMLTAALSAALLIACAGAAPTAPAAETETSVRETAVENTSEETTEGSSVAEGPAEAPAEILPLEITDFGYTVQPKTDLTIETYAYYGFQLHNPNTDTGAYLPKVRITGRDAEGKVVGTDEQTLMYVGPSETVSFGSVVSYGDSVPETVDIEFVSTETIDAAQTRYNSPDDYIISGTSEQADAFGTKIVGEITNSSESTQSTTAVTVLLRKEGNIVYGMTTFVNDLEPGTATPFEAACYGTVPEHDSYEVYAQGWL